MNKKISLLAISLLLTACGGGGGSVPVSTLPEIVGNGTSTPVSPSPETGGNAGSDPVSPLPETGGNAGSDPVSILPETTIAELNNIIRSQSYEFTAEDFALNDKNETVGVDKRYIENGPIDMMNITLGGSTIEGGLSYTDFGYKNNEQDWGDMIFRDQPYMIVIQPERFELTPTENMTFKGKAYASVHEPNAVMFEEVKIVSGDASLNVNPTQQTESLTINFDNWYDVTFRTDSNGIASVDFKEGQNYQDNGVKFESRYSAGMEYVQLNLDIGYYGANNKVSEASGEFSLGNYYGPCLRGSFGAKKQ